MRLTLVRFNQSVPFAAVPEWLHSKRAANPKKYDKKIIHVTSEKLCDDALQILKSSLPPPKTCDIIELNPGPCVWARKIHTLLEPRRHVLVEPEHHIFAECIDPLLQQPDSPYRLARTVREAFDPRAGLLSEDTYSFQERIEKSNGPRFKTNENLLLIANVSSKARTVAGFSGSVAKQFLNEFYRAVFVRDKFVHRYGLIRLLAWISEDSRKSIIPTTVNLRTKQSIQLEASCRIDEIAGPSQYAYQTPKEVRYYDIDVENQDLVLKEGRELDFQIDSSRSQPDLVPPFASLKPDIQVVRKNKALYPYHQTYIRNVLKIDERLAADCPKWYARYHDEAARGFIGNRLDTRAHKSNPMQRAYRTYMIQLRTHHNTYLKARDFIWEQRKLFQKIRNGFLKGWFSKDTGLPKEGEHKTAATKLLEHDEFLQNQSQIIKKDTQLLVNKAGDDYCCFDNQIMAWNRRRFEPLLVQNSEFLPQHPLTLMDFRPDPSLPTRLDTIDKQICFDYVCTMLMCYPNDTIAKGLSKLVPAGLELFIEGIPELRDPTIGGWWNLEYVKVRAMHTDLFVAIALAFHDWPRRPLIDRLMASQGTFMSKTVPI